MKRVALVLLLLALLFTEAYLASAFLPKSWQVAIQRVLPGGHDNSYTTHPNLEREIDQVLSRYLALRVLFDAVLVLFLAGNTVLLITVWKSLRRISIIETVRWFSPLIWLMSGRWSSMFSVDGSDDLC